MAMWYYRPQPHRIALAMLALTATAAAAQPTDTITITARSATAAAIGGFGDVPLSRSPLQASVYGRETLVEAGTGSIGDLTRLDASLGDAYNAEGYWSFLTVRGFVLDNRANYRRDGLPVSAETFLPLANKERIEVLKGASGIQAGTSAPGGLVNLVVKRPQAAVRQANLQWQQSGSLIAALDLGDRAGSEGRFGWRINAQAAHLDPLTRNAQGSSRLLALAADWLPSKDSHLEFEVETSHRSQPSAPGFSLLGNRVPDPGSIDPRSNLNNQTWSQPVVLDGDTASLRWRQALSADWALTAQASRQRLHSDDRVAFPFGCYDAKADVYWADRYCPDGSIDLYDFRSDGERRHFDAGDLHIEGVARIGGMTHRVTAGWLGTRVRERFNRQAFNFAGTGNIDTTSAVPAAPELAEENTQRDERSREAYLRDAIELGERWQLWAGVRHTRLDRRSVRTDGSRATAYEQAFTTPWIALAWQPAADWMVYASSGQGVESEVVPNRSRYTNAGQALPALKSRQHEVGLKHAGESIDWSLAWFDIRRPLAQDRCTETEPVTCVRAVDDPARHRGVEGTLVHRIGPWALQASGAWLDARLQGTGLRPVNVPRHSLRAQVQHENAWLPGLSVTAALIAEGKRHALPDNSAPIEGWMRADLGARYRHRMGGARLTWRAGVTNATDRRAWRESPYQFGHSYLFPLAPRTWRVSLQIDL